MRLFIKIIIFLILFPIFTITINAEEYSFNLKDDSLYPDKKAEEFINSLPDEIKNKTVDINTENASNAASKYDFNFFWNEIAKAIATYLPSSISVFGSVSSLLIITSLFDRLSNTINCGACNGAFNFCSGITIALAVYTLKEGSYQIAISLLATLTNTMTLMVPLMEAIYISAGNTGLAAVTGTGMAIILTVVETLFTKILTPAVSVCFVFAVLASATDNPGLAYLSKALRTIITTAIIFIMSMTSIVLSLQTGISASADKFSARAVRFALGSYIPLVGGAVSESLSALSGSISLIKQLAGTTGIVVIILIIIPPLVSLIMTRISLYFTSVVAGILGCEKGKSLLDDIGGTYTMLLSITLCASLAFIYALSIFCKAPLALS